jgi:hypothetical protein
MTDLDTTDASNRDTNDREAYNGVEQLLVPLLNCTDLLTQRMWIYLEEHY